MSHNQKSTKLEWTIIILIGAEIVIGICGHIIPHFNLGIPHNLKFTMNDNNNNDNNNDNDNVKNKKNNNSNDNNLANDNDIWGPDGDAVETPHPLKVLFALMLRAQFLHHSLYISFIYIFNYLFNYSFYFYLLLFYDAITAR